MKQPKLRKIIGYGILIALAVSMAGGLIYIAWKIAPIVLWILGYIARVVSLAVFGVLLINSEDQ